MKANKIFWVRLQKKRRDSIKRQIILKEGGLA
jgi:hypothetical protein